MGSRKTAQLKLKLSILLRKICEFHKTFPRRMSYIALHVFVIVAKDKHRRFKKNLVTALKLITKNAVFFFFQIKKYILTQRYV